MTATYIQEVVVSKCYKAAAPAVKENSFYNTSAANGKGNQPCPTTVSLVCVAIAWSVRQ